MNIFEKNLKKLREMISGKEPLSFEDFIKVTRLQYDTDNFQYYLERIPASDGGDSYAGNRFFEVSGGVVWDAEKRHDLRGLLQTIIDHVEWIEPSFYKLGLHYDELKERERL